MFWKRRRNVSVAVSKATHLLSHKNTTLQSAPSCTLAWTHLPHRSAKCFSNAWLFIWLNRQVIRQLMDSVSYSSCHITMLLWSDNFSHKTVPNCLQKEANFRHLSPSTRIWSSVKAAKTTDGSPVCQSHATNSPWWKRGPRGIYIWEELDFSRHYLTTDHAPMKQQSHITGKNMTCKLEVTKPV